MEIYLHCCQGSHPDIFLPNGETLFIGRSAMTKIAETRCSR